jgi:hypothetical protein
MPVNDRKLRIKNDVGPITKEGNKSFLLPSNTTMLT